MREIKFRGSLLNESNPYKKGEVIEGGYCKEGDKHFIVVKHNTFEVDPESVQEFTGFKDKKGIEIFEGNILSDWTDVDGEQVQSKMQVYWCEKTGAWKLDNSFNQDKSSGDLLSEELSDFDYEIKSIR